MVLAFLLLFTTDNAFCSKERKLHADSSDATLEIVFCVDLSGSMNGVLTDLQNQYWFIVNMIRLGAPGKELKIGLVGFSRPSFGRENSYVKILCPLTCDLDQVVAAFYRLRPSIEKGDQIVSAALRTSVLDMQWSPSTSSEKMIFLIGNGMAHSGLHDYVKFAELAKTKNIRVHTFYARTKSNYIKEIPGWRRIAGISGGDCQEFSLQSRDSVSVWPVVPDTALLILNQKYNELLLTALMEGSELRRSLCTADSGAFHADPDAWQHRLYFKTSDAYMAKFKGCEESSLQNTEVGPAHQQDSLRMLKEKRIEIVRQCNAIRSSMREKIKDAGLNQLKKDFAENKIQTGEILRRCIVYTVYKSDLNSEGTQK